MSYLQSVFFANVCKSRTQFQEELGNIGQQRIFQRAFVVRLRDARKGEIVRIFRQFLSEVTCCFGQGAREVSQRLAFTLVLISAHNVEKDFSAPPLFYGFLHIEKRLCGFCTEFVHQIAMLTPGYGKKHFFQLSHGLWDFLAF